MATRRLRPEEIDQRLKSVPAWQRVGEAIRREYECTDFMAAIAFVRQVAEAAERADHHPDIDIRYDRVTLTFSTHSAGGLTDRDFELAAAADGLFPG